MVCRSGAVQLLNPSRRQQRAGPVAFATFKRYRGTVCEALRVR